MNLWERKEKAKEWLIRKGAMGSFFPTYFDLPLMWKLNAKRCKGFNIIFIWLYPVFFLFAFLPTVFGLVEAALSHEDKEKEEKRLQIYYTEV